VHPRVARASPLTPCHRPSRSTAGGADFCSSSQVLHGSRALQWPCAYLRVRSLEQFGRPAAARVRAEGYVGSAGERACLRACIAATAHASLSRPALSARWPRSTAQLVPQRTPAPSPGVRPGRRLHVALPYSLQTLQTLQSHYAPRSDFCARVVLLVTRRSITSVRRARPLRLLQRFKDSPARGGALCARPNHHVDARSHYLRARDHRTTRQRTARSAVPGARHAVT